MMVEKQVIYIDKITSISESIFSFKFGNDFIDADLLPLKVKVNPSENTNYHLDADDLRKMHELEETIYPYTPESNMKKNDYIDYMRERWIELIQEGRFLSLIEHATDRSFKLYEVKWVGNE